MQRISVLWTSRGDVQSSSVLCAVPHSPGKAWCSRLPGKMQCQGGQVSASEKRRCTRQLNPMGAEEGAKQLRPL